VALLLLVFYEELMAKGSFLDRLTISPAVIPSQRLEALNCVIDNATPASCQNHRVPRFRYQLVPRDLQIRLPTPMYKPLARAAEFFVG